MHCCLRALRCSVRSRQSRSTCSPGSRRFIGAYIDFYNSQRPHQSLDYKTPDEVYFEDGHRPVDMMDKPDGLPSPLLISLFEH